jgi:hypothetical protein
MLIAKHRFNGPLVVRQRFWDGEYGNVCYFDTEEGG